MKLLDLRRLSAMGAAATLGVAQPLFTLILENPDEFPLGGLFHLWVLVWTFLLPLAGLLLIDALLERTRPRIFEAWTALLCAGGAASLLLQAFTYNLERLDRWGLLGAFFPGAVALAALTFALGFKHPAPTRRYLAVLGPLALILLGSYAVRSGLWGPAWAPIGRDAGEPDPAAAETPVFLVVFDELSKDVLLKDGRIDAENYPRFAAFAAENAWFPDATTNYMHTDEAIPCILTGRLRPGPETPSLFNFLHGKYLPTLIGGWPLQVPFMRRGAKDALEFEVRGSLEEISRSPMEVAGLLASCARNALLLRTKERNPYATMLPGMIAPLKQPEIIAQILARRAGPGLLVYWHSIFPHSPYAYDRHGRKHNRPEVLFESHLDPRKVFENYLEQTRLADALFGRFLDALRGAGIYDRAIIVVTSDHGLRTTDALQPPGYPAVMNGLTPNIPFFLKAPGLRPGPNEAEYQHIDLVPTLLDLLDVPREPGAFDGVSLFAAERPARPKVTSKPGFTYLFDDASGLWHLKK